MHTGNQPPFAGGLAQQDLPGTPGLFRIRRRRRPRLLAAQTEWTGNGRCPPISSEVSPASRRYPVCPGVWPGRGHGRIPAITSSSSTPLICAAQFASTRRTSRRVAPAAIAGVVERGCCQPVSAFPRRQEHRGVGIRWRTSGGQQAADMVRMGVGQKDGVDLLGPTPSRARLAISSPPTPLAPPVPVSTSTVFPRPRIR